MMGLATASLGWSPGAFWAATPHDLWAAIEQRQLDAARAAMDAR